MVEEGGRMGTVDFVGEGVEGEEERGEVEVEEHLMVEERDSVTADYHLENGDEAKRFRRGLVGGDMGGAGEEGIDCKLLNFFFNQKKHYVYSQGNKESCLPPKYLEHIYVCTCNTTQSGTCSFALTSSATALRSKAEKRGLVIMDLATW